MSGQEREKWSPTPSLPIALEVTWAQLGQASVSDVANGNMQTDRRDAVEAHSRLLCLLPASYRPGRGYIAGSRDIAECVAQELNINRLSKVKDWIWLAGLPLPPRSLHHQLLMNRDILVTEQMDMHLIWTAGRIFVKPMPRFLLDREFWATYINCEDGCPCTEQWPDNHPIVKKTCPRRKPFATACGFVYSYVALISHESDFQIAKEKHLLPPEVQWQTWLRFIQYLDMDRTRDSMDERFVHGELRLSRLNKIYNLHNLTLKGYMSQWDQYGAYFRYHFAWLASTTVYIAIVLTAMQVGLANKTLVKNDSFQSAAYGFTIFAILGPLIFTAIVLIRFVYMFVGNFVKAADAKKRYYEKPRFSH